MKRYVSPLAFPAFVSAGLLVLMMVVHSQPRVHAQAANTGAAQQPPGAPGGGQGFNPGTENGIATFQTRCFVCHGHPKVPEAPLPTAIRTMTPERIYNSLVKSSIKGHNIDMPDAEKRRVAEYMAGRSLGSNGAGDARKMPNLCGGNPPLTSPADGAAWNGWGRSIANTRFQPAAGAGLTAADVPRLKLKWAFGYPFGESSNSQPTVVSGRVFVGSDNGYVYSLDAKTGCVYWSFEAGSIIRNSPAVGPVSGQGSARYAVYFGDGHGNAYALDAQTGRLLWKTRADSHLFARITAGVAVYNGKVFVPVSSSEEFRSGDPNYPCCTFRGSVVALDANTGKQIWKAWVVPGEPAAWVTQDNGVKLYRPGGGAVWNSPTIDPLRNAVYFGTGDATTPPSPTTTDGVMAVDIDTGKLLWSYQATEDDVFMGGCTGEKKSLACPDPMGPDADIGNSPILATLTDGRRVLLTGTKAGDILALDPDRKGALLYRVGAGGGPAVGPKGRRRSTSAIVWGGAADDQYAYYGMGQGGLAAVRLTTGEYKWTFIPPAASQGARRGSLGAAPTAIPGVIFQGSSNGMLYAVSSAEGKLLWQFDTAGKFETVNRIPAHGGELSSIGAVAANGMLFIGSGYAVNSGNSGGNVLLAFAAE